MERRTFLMGMAASTSLLGANDRINLAIVGLGGRGADHMKIYSQIPGCRVAGVCDVDSGRLEKGETLIYQSTGAKPKTYRDMRQAFDDKDIDAVSIVTCNHWHALATIWACQAGKDVYTEKPASHNIWEGRKMVEAARKYKRMVQVGSQSRSIAHKREAIDLLKQGIIGKVYMAKGLCFKRRLSIGHKPDGPPPPGIDYDLWLGPAPMRPFNPNRFHYNWHWFWDTGNGDIGNQGVHEMDIARWGLGVGLPKSVVSTGGKYVYDDDQETPNTQLASYDYGDKQIVFEVRGLLTGSESGIPADGKNFIGNIFLGSDGYMMVDLDSYKVYLGEERKLERDVKFKEKTTWDPAPHMKNFLDVCRGRKHEDLNADIENGHLSAAMCHLGNVSYRLGRKLTFDPVTEMFVSDAEANKMRTREYRKPYVVPAQV